MRCRCNKAIRPRYAERWETESGEKSILGGRLPLVEEKSRYGSLGCDNYVVGMKMCISLLKSASHSATLSFQPTLTEKKSLVY